MAKVKKQAPRKAVSLKDKLQKQAKIVKVDSLDWKAVEIPDNLGSYDGFFGLEEIDGVDVEVVNGVPKFKVRDSKPLKKEAKKEVEPESEPEMDVDDEEEFTGFDDEPEEIDEKPKEQKKEKPKKTNEKPKKKAQPKPKEAEVDQLKGNTFSMDVALPEENISLAHWDFLDLNDYTLNGLQALDFKKPTPIQKQAIPLAIAGKDVIGKASTGSGKTLAYGIPILEKYLSKVAEFDENRKNGIINAPVGIIFAPTRELAHQVVDHLNKISKYSPLTQHGIVSITGGLSIQKQERLLKNGPGILVATPGRFLELMEKDEDLCKRLASTDIVVLDEADRLLQNGHFDEFEKILDMFKKHRPKGLSSWKWQTLVFSATFAKDLFNKLDKNQRTKKNDSTLAEDDGILQLLNEKLNFKDKKPAIIDVNPEETVSGQITEALVECGATERDLYLYYFLLMYKGTTLVFANSIDSVKRLGPFLNSLNIPAFSIHSSMIQKQRLRALERFKAASETNETAVLIASDVAARGLDIPNIDHVAHYHLPRSADVYIHRSGRTARAGKQGVSVSFCSPQEAAGPLRKLRALVANSSRNTRLNASANVKMLPLEMDLVGQLKPRVEIATILADSIVSSVSTKKEDTWVKQAAEDLGIDDLSDVEDYEDDIIKKQRKRKEGKLLEKKDAQGLRAELKELLSHPIRKLSRRSYLTSGLENLAHIMVTGNTHKDVLGHKNVQALDDLKGRKAETRKFKKKPNKVVKANKKK